jgi:hypothetical protein
VPSLIHSPAALDTLKHFHRVSFVVYVEGPEDVPYWNHVLKHFELEAFHLKVAGGSEEIEKYCDAILTEDTEICVARDLDLSDVLGCLHDHARILHTYGYSIENSLCRPDAVSRVTQALALTTEPLAATYSNWLGEFAVCCRPLVELDLANRMGDGTAKVPLGSCQRFVVGRTDAVVDAAKVSAAVRTLRREISPDLCQAAAQQLDGSEKPLGYRVRGHFLVSGVRLFILKEVKARRGKNISLSGEALFALLIGQFVVDELEFDEKEHLRQQVVRLKEAAPAASTPAAAGTASAQSHDGPESVPEVPPSTDMLPTPERDS